MLDFEVTGYFTEDKHLKAFPSLLPAAYFSLNESSVFLWQQNFLQSVMARPYFYVT
jgi:hypothetical protein